MPRKKDTELESINKFYARIDTSGDCHLWRGPRVGIGYGQVYCAGMNWRAHRLMWTLKVGPIDDGLVVAHHCDNPLCVNIEHLYICTQAQNIADRDRKKRQARGERSGRALLADADIDRIKDMLVCNAKVKDIAKWFGVHRTTIGKIKNGQNWRWHVPKPLCEVS